MSARVELPSQPQPSVGGRARTQCLQLWGRWDSPEEEGWLPVELSRKAWFPGALAGDCAVVRGSQRRTKDKSEKRKHIYVLNV